MPSFLQRSRRLALVLAVLLTPMIAACLTVIPDGPGWAEAGTGPAAYRHVGRWTVDNQGRVVLGNGLNIVVKGAPFYPSRFSAADAKFLANEGFTIARIGFIWEAVEPKPGVFDTAYIKRLARINDLLGQYGIHTIIDFHQDGYSAKDGGDGAPAWASLDGPLCVAGNPVTCQLSSATVSFQHFWDNDQAPDGVGLQDHYANAWRHVLPYLKGSSNVVGYDLMNEPYPGYKTGCAPFTPCPSFEEGDLAAFYRKLIPVVRAIDPVHQIIYEPTAQLLNTESALPAPLMKDSNLGFSFHVYVRDCSSAPQPPDALIPLQQAHCSIEDALAIDNNLDHGIASRAATTMGEWGDSDNYTDMAQMVDLMGARFLPWTEWQYYTSIASGAPGLLIDDTKPGSQANARQGRLNSLVTPRPVEVAGTPLAWSFDRGTRVMELSYGTKPFGRRLADGARTRIFVPRHYPHGYRLSVTGARVLSSRTSPWVVLVARPGAAKVTVTIRPARDSRVALPFA